ncbi:hypothetical protein DPMN_179413 [Dreissena polymorpha]|uniref:Uncharacterized protein n=1 Tax=Dreissena polymorpha TaxID=45954 RepID=A0A9D4EH46_DREPO|nr:hypothetical protein DPMN_179413 [Dreissena polymorpha]
MAMLDPGKTSKYVFWFTRVYITLFVAIFTIVVINLLVEIFLRAYESIRVGSNFVAVIHVQ